MVYHVDFIYTTIFGYYYYTQITIMNKEKLYSVMNIGTKAITEVVAFLIGTSEVHIIPFNWSGVLFRYQCFFKIPKWALLRYKCVPSEKLPPQWQLYFWDCITVSNDVYDQLLSILSCFCITACTILYCCLYFLNFMLFCSDHIYHLNDLLPI